MRIESNETCKQCIREITVYTIGDTPSQCNSLRTLPAWTRCGCGWGEISTSRLEEIVPDWREHLAPDEEEGGSS